MSDTVRTDEIDEVVSSVRKLVSHGEKNVRPQQMNRDYRLQSNRYVLTPALRVADPDAVTEDDPEKVLVLDAAKRADRAGLEATIAELEAAVIAQPDDWEPDDGENFDEAAWAASAFQLHAMADAAVEPDLAEDAPPQAAQDASDAQPQDDSTHLPLDQDALRAMVVDILREELAGDMGERITRNVRKLVRREINRVLVSREMEED